ncbi:MAG: amino acid permease [Negativicutes bacterium]
MKKIDADQGLRRDLGFWPALAIVVGTIIGAGVFMKPAVVLQCVDGSKELGMLAWIIGGVMVLTGGLTVAELGAMIPKTGGLYAYLEEIYGETVSYMYGWMRTVVFAPANLAALALYVAVIFNKTFGLPQDKLWILAIAFATLLLMLLINIPSTKYSGYFQTLATGVKLIPIIVIAVCGLMFGKETMIQSAPTVAVAADHNIMTGMGLAVLATLFAYDGFTNVSFVAGEMKNPARLMPLTTIIGIVIVMVAYIGVNLSVYHVLSSSEILGMGSLTSVKVAENLFGIYGERLINIGMLISMFGSMNGYILALSRVPYAMACRNQLPFSGVFRKIHTAFGTPVNSLILIFVLCCLALPFNADKLTDLSILSLWIFYILTYFGVFILRKREPDRLRPFRVPLYPFVPIFALLAGVWVFVSTFIGEPLISLASCGITLAGLPVLWLCRRYYAKYE